MSKLEVALPPIPLNYFFLSFFRNEKIVQMGRTVREREREGGILIAVNQV